MVALTPREAEIVRLVASGHTNGSIATALSLSVRTIESTLRTIYSKCNVAGRAELVLLVQAGDKEKVT